MLSNTEILVQNLDGQLKEMRIKQRELAAEISLLQAVKMQLESAIDKDKKKQGE
jgi:hypothetical protein